MAPTPLRFDRRMSGAEALMWELDADPQLSSTFANLSELDRPLDVDRLRRRLARAMVTVPRLGQRVHVSPGRLLTPAWIDEPVVDLDHHVRSVTLEPPGDRRQLLDLAAAVAAEPFDRTRPLWQFVAVNGLHGGRGALIQKLHHTLADGEGMIQVSAEF